MDYNLHYTARSQGFGDFLLSAIGAYQKFGNDLRLDFSHSLLAPFFSASQVKDCWIGEDVKWKYLPIDELNITEACREFIKKSIELKWEIPVITFPFDVLHIRTGWADKNWDKRVPAWLAQYEKDRPNIEKFMNNGNKFLYLTDYEKNCHSTYSSDPRLLLQMLGEFWAMSGAGKIYTYSAIYGAKGVSAFAKSAALLFNKPLINLCNLLDF